MSFHKKALITFVIFHLVFTLGGLLADSLQMHPGPTNDRDMIAKGVGFYVWVIFTAVISLVAIGLAYLIGFVLLFLIRCQIQSSDIEKGRMKS